MFCIVNSFGSFQKEDRRGHLDSATDLMGTYELVHTTLTNREGFIDHQTLYIW